MSDIAVNALANSEAKTSNSSNKLAKDLDSFLLLLTSQLKNPDPLSPMDSTEFTNQLTQFAQVEQQINMNAGLNNLVGLTQQSIAGNAVNYIGKTIEGPSSSAPRRVSNPASPGPAPTRWTVPVCFMSGGP